MRTTVALTLVCLGLSLAARPARAQYTTPSYYAPSVAPESYGDSGSDLRHGGLAMVYLGANIPVGTYAADFNTGLSVGGILGLHINHDTSLNGEFTAHVLNSPRSASYESEYIYSGSFSPLYHLGQGNLELAVGPKLGFFGYYFGYDDGYEIVDTESRYGFVYGLNAAVFVQATPVMSVGGLVSFTGHHATKACVVDRTGWERCGTSDVADLKMFTISGALRW